MDKQRQGVGVGSAAPRPSRIWFGPKVREVGWRGIVLPDKSLGDKILAATHVSEAIGIPLDELEIEYWGGGDDIPDTVQDEWERRLLYPIDVGMKRYHDQHNRYSAGSATERVMYDFGLQGDPLVKEDADLANRNNENAFLKNKPNSYFLILRQWHIMGLATEWVVPEVHKVCLVRIQARRVPADERARLRAAAEQDPILRPYFHGIFRALHETGVSTKPPSELEKPLPMHPFTMQEYCSNLFVIGTPVEEIRQKMEEHISLKASADQERQDTAEEYHAIRKERFAKEDAVVLFTDNPYAASYATKRDGALVAVVQTSSGHRMICAQRGADFQLDALFAVLDRHEQGLWYKVPPRAGELLLNGGLTRKGITPSGFPLEALKRLIEVNCFNY